MEIYSKEDIDLQDLFLALTKKFETLTDFYIHLVEEENELVITLEDCNSRLRNGIKVWYDLKKQFNNQKEEVYKKLIEILK